MRAPSLRVVIDTNVWISGLLTKSGPPAQLTRHVIRAAQPVFSEETFAELQDRLWRPKFDRYISIEQRQAFLRDAASIAFWVKPPPELATLTLCRDPADDKFIHAAMAAQCVWLVSGDKDLLDCAARTAEAGVRILTPAQALCLPEFASQG